MVVVVVSKRAPTSGRAVPVGGLVEEGHGSGSGRSALAAGGLLTLYSLPSRGCLHARMHARCSPGSAVFSLQVLALTCHSAGERIDSVNLGQWAEARDRSLYTEQYGEASVCGREASLLVPRPRIRRQSPACGRGGCMYSLRICTHTLSHSKAAWVPGRRAVWHCIRNLARLQLADKKSNPSVQPKGDIGRLKRLDKPPTRTRPDTRHSFTDVRRSLDLHLHLHLWIVCNLSPTSLPHTLAAAIQPIMATSTPLLLLVPTSKSLTPPVLLRRGPGKESHAV